MNVSFPAGNHSFIQDPMRRCLLGERSRTSRTGEEETPRGITVSCCGAWAGWGQREAVGSQGCTGRRMWLLDRRLVLRWVEKSRPSQQSHAALQFLTLGFFQVFETEIIIKKPVITLARLLVQHTR